MLTQDLLYHMYTYYEDDALCASLKKLSVLFCSADVETSVELLHPLFIKIWGEEKFQQSKKRITQSSFPRKSKSVPAPTTEISHCCPSQERCLIASC
ncbi:hypothetical protein DPMN_121468 [Dreissena polymorpha]|uniref:Uncharacterized protein n=1 Tax=Dreissena polymorpha TaxID=45954 RepID=A0A9D4JPG3_DREPO|nr:hypothetical protein DPMN_121468 [Dreissena polymorpha]